MDSLPSELLGKPKNIRTGCHAVLQGIFLTWEQTCISYLLHWQAGSLPLPPPQATFFQHVFAAAAKSLQSCPTLCDPIDGSPRGSPVPGILQARTLEWVAISFSNAWKWKVKVKTLSHVQLFATPWTEAYQAPPSMGFSRQEYWSGLPLPSRVTLLQSLIIYRTIHLINCFKSSHHFHWRLSHILSNTRNKNLVNKQNTNGIVNNISGIKSK